VASQACIRCLCKPAGIILGNNNVRAAPERGNAPLSTRRRYHSPLDHASWHGEPCLRCFAKTSGSVPGRWVALGRLLAAVRSHEGDNIALGISARSPSFRLGPSRSRRRRLHGADSHRRALGRWRRVTNGGSRERRRREIVCMVLTSMFRAGALPVAELPAPLRHPTPDVSVGPGALGRKRWVLSRNSDGGY